MRASNFLIENGKHCDIKHDVVSMDHPHDTRKTRANNEETCSTVCTEQGNWIDMR
jgi:hypothetical protein